jgi:F0F1-type ATP synthase membrane subunit b/b'
MFLNMAASFIDTISDRITIWVGSTVSLLIHTIWFLLAFSSHWFFGWGFDFILLVLTTVVSLEAIYISIFIQRAVNQQSIRLHDVEESIDDVEEALDDVEEALDDVEEALDDVEETLSEEEEEEKAANDLRPSMEELMKEMRALLEEMKATDKEKKKNHDS